jgi:hypothetical protein
MTQKTKISVESPPQTGTIHIEPDQLDIDDYVVIQVRPKPGMEKDAVQWRGQPPPGPGPRKCWACGFKWVLLPGGEDICPRCNRPNVIKETEPMNIRFVFKEQPQHDSSPEEEIKRSKDMLRSQGETKLTVGDISLVMEKRRKEDQRWNRKPINNEPGITIGDLFIYENDGRGLDGLYQGKKPYDVKPSTSESQRIVNEHIRNFKEKQYKKLLEKQATYELRIEKENH